MTVKERLAIAESSRRNAMVDIDKSRDSSARYGASGAAG